MFPRRGLTIWIPTAIVALGLIIGLALWAATVFVAIWTGDGIPAAWEVVVGIMGGLLGWW